MNITDTHCHIDLAVFDADRDSIIKNCLSLGINRLVVPAIAANSWDNLLNITRQYSCLSHALGLHPVFIRQHKPSDISSLEQYINQHKPIAVGEIGLDFFIENPDREKQKDVFNDQLLLAEQHRLPVILHVRKAHDDVLALLKSKKITGGSCHAFNGSLDQAKRYIDLGFKLGFGGTMTYPNARKIHELARQLPLESILLETDAPDMSGFSHQGSRNQPDFIIDALKALADIKSMSLQELAMQTTDNAREVFGFS
ncbi:MAG: TatD family hydrolase [Gammaproteobacteria bacterium]|nr:TatD family hydrolase [Gammaproteobacteria bacterium]